MKRQITDSISENLTDSDLESIVDENVTEQCNNKLLKIFAILQYFNKILLRKCNVNIHSRYCEVKSQYTCKVIFRNYNTSVLNLL